MRGAQLLVILTVGFLLTSSVSSRPNQNRGLQDGNLSSADKTLIGRIAAAIPGAQDLHGGGFNLPGVGHDWTVVRSISDETQLTQRELEVIRRIADSVVSGDDNGRGGGDWTIVKSIELRPSQFEGGNFLEKIPAFGGAGGGSIDSPLLKPPPPSCGLGFVFFREQCRMIVSRQ